MNGDIAYSFHVAGENLVELMKMIGDKKIDGFKFDEKNRCYAIKSRFETPEEYLKHIHENNGKEKYHNALEECGIPEV